jgi:hypothetical protein
MTVKKILLAAALSAAFIAGASAQTWDGYGYGSGDQSIPPRDPPFGKGNPGNDTMHLPNSAGPRFNYDTYGNGYYNSNAWDQSFPARRYHYERTQ